MFPLRVFIGKQPSDSSNIASAIVFGGAVRHSLTYALRARIEIGARRTGPAGTDLRFLFALLHLV